MRYPLLHASERTSGTAGAQSTSTRQHDAAPSASWTPAGNQGFAAIGENAATGQGDQQRGRTGTSRTQQQIFGTPQVGVIGRHKPRDMIRLDRDYTAGEVCQFWSGYPFELEGRVRPRAYLRQEMPCRSTHSPMRRQITATEHLNVMNELNSILASAFDPRKSIFDNVTAVLTLYLSTWLLSSHYDRVCCSLSLSLPSSMLHMVFTSRERFPRKSLDSTKLSKKPMLDCTIPRGSTCSMRARTRSSLYVLHCAVDGQIATTDRSLLRDFQLELEYY